MTQIIMLIWAVLPGLLAASPALHILNGTEGPPLFSKQKKRRADLRDCYRGPQDKCPIPASMAKLIFLSSGVRRVGCNNILLEKGSSENRCVKMGARLF
jgi:hypothetical protein